MNCTDCTAKLHDYADGDLAAADRGAVETHLAHCPSCRAESESLGALLRATAALPKDVAPSRDLWRGIERAVAETEPSAAEADFPANPHAAQSPIDLLPPKNAAQPRRSNLLHLALPFAAAASIVFLATFTPRHNFAPHNAGTWAVASVAGTPRVGTKALRGEGQLRIGQWLETDAASRARVSVGQIGEVTVDPNSRLRMLETATADSRNHRLELSRGTMHAFIIAPPRIFVVDTPTAKAVDLGCAYTLNVDDNGNGTLHVSTGYVALETPGRESYIPGGAMCQTRRGTGPGTPFMTDAPKPLQAALERIDFQRDKTEATLREVLDSARTDDAVTLWHLLARTDGNQRAAVFDKLADLRTPPAGVTRTGILAGDAAMRRTWASDLGLGPW